MHTVLIFNIFTWFLASHQHIKKNATLTAVYFLVFLCKHYIWFQNFCIFTLELYSESDLVYEVEGHSSLANSHLFRLEIQEVLVTDAVHARLQFPGNLIFLPVLLSLHL